MDGIREAPKTETNSSLSSTVGFSSESMISSFALFIMAIGPIYVGARRSVVALKKSLENENAEIITKTDMAKFPIYASCVLLGIYIVFKVFAAEYINIILAAYFLFIGSSTTFSLISLVPSSFPDVGYALKLTESPEGVESSTEYLNFQFSRKDIFPLVISTAVGVTYIVTRHWLANNVIGIAISITAIELLHLDRVINGCILLGGLFFYDIFWVFATDVMVSVAKSFNAPIKVVFPRDIISGGFFSNELSMLGLGDIVIPGIFIALLLRYDFSLNQHGKKTYFITGFIAYVVGLLATFAAMYIFKHAQPALLYLVPTCLGFPLSVAFLKGDLSSMMAYKDIPSEIAEKIQTNSAKDKKTD